MSQRIADVPTIEQIRVFTCDACGKDEASLVTPDGWWVIRQNSPTSTPYDMDFCNIDCLKDYFGEGIPADMLRRDREMS